MKHIETLKEQLDIVVNKAYTEILDDYPTDQREQLPHSFEELHEQCDANEYIADYIADLTGDIGNYLISEINIRLKAEDRSKYKRTTKQVIAEQQAINRKLRDKENPGEEKMDLIEAIRYELKEYGWDCQTSNPPSPFEFIKKIDNIINK
tara:strand:- start:2634 stop:3083 length:450 start_codon:yes stop_codon:yes gene_type:complete